MGEDKIIVLGKKYLRRCGLQEGGHLGVIKACRSLLFSVPNGACIFIILMPERLGCFRGSVLASDTQVRSFKPGRSRWIFKGR